MDHANDEPDDTRGDCIRRLAGHREALRHALAGREFHVLVTYREPSVTVGVLFTAQGQVVQIPGPELDPQIELRGTADQVRRFLVGDLSLYEAVVERVVVLHIEPDEALAYRMLRDVVADALR